MARSRFPSPLPRGPTGGLAAWPNATPPPPSSRWLTSRTSRGLDTAVYRRLRRSASSRALVLNYCPLVFMEASGKNRTPDKLPRGEQAPLLAACDAALRAAVLHVRPLIVSGVGA